MNSETTCGLNNSYMEAYLGMDNALLLKRCGGSDFSLPAFLFSFFHCYRKKMYRECIIFLAAIVIIPLILGATAGISRMEGGITLSSVYHELRRLPLKYTFTLTAGGGVIPDGIRAYHEHEPAFRFWQARLAGTIAVSLFCGLSFNRLQKRKAEKDIVCQLSRNKAKKRNRTEKYPAKGRYGEQPSRPRKAFCLSAVGCCDPFAFLSHCISASALF